MAQYVFFLTDLQAGAIPAEYENWVREVNYPTARSLPSIASYQVIRIDGGLPETPAITGSYLEVIEVSDVDAYQQDVANLPGREQFMQQIGTFFANTVAGYGTAVE
ncbi:hypothetical protein LWC35_10305 [Pseudonocardia kujensis]|uniref:hypothetical protein n=1 Tax=Pseudonocardia kujensis TaxID=1128675 RepID=UPI001E3804B3|nr:hypothetical protein [Pseudonocardia kujensis]MCE0763295.1 hypothetical protein [Pseudonocardia kujensis]